MRGDAKRFPAHDASAVSVCPVGSGVTGLRLVIIVPVGQRFGGLAVVAGGDFFGGHGQAGHGRGLRRRR